MTQAKHTPGPWVVRTIDQSLATVETANGEFIITNAGQLRADDWKTEHAERKANAALMAAAPELLEALQMLLKESSVAFQASGFPAYMQESVIRSRSAIAKATGGAS